ncbi:MAG: putative secreted hydrolase [Mycobacterium sp.]|nr:putative secreted hydrolase [Mycobacterium sp.]
MRRYLIAAVAALAAAALALAPSGFASSAPLNYVALGDSYSAASGNIPPDLTAPLLCLRSVRNYPHMLATATGAHLTDVTCGGAETKDFFTGQYPGVAPQLNAVGSSADVVTMTIGGNDSGVFIDSIVECGALGTLSLGQGSPCKNTYGDSFDTTIRTVTYPVLVNALTAVRKAAPHAKVAIIGYPSILPPSGGCFPQMPVASGDVPYLDEEQATLNDAVRRAAAATGATYVDMTQVSQGHDACKAVGTRWVEPVVGTTNPVVVHPNPLGEAAMGTQTLQALGLGGSIPTPVLPIG